MWKMFIMIDLTDVYVPESISSPIWTYVGSILYLRNHAMGFGFVETDMRFLLQQLLTPNFYNAYTYG